VGKAGVAAGRPATALGIAAIVLLQQALLWAILLTNPFETTVTWDAVAGAMGVEVLRGFSFSWLDTWDGVLGGIFVGVLWGTPLFALFGVSGLTVKLAATLWSGLTAMLGGLLGAELGGRRAAWALALGLALPPPIHVYGGLVLGNWHVGAVAFALLAALLLVHHWRRWPTRPSWAASLGTGLALGAALFQSFEGLIPLAPMAVAGWALFRSRWGPGRLLAVAMGVGIGVAPMVWKVAGHSPFGLPTSEHRTKVPAELLHLSLDPAKLSQLLPGGGVGWGLHYQDAFRVPRGTVPQMILAETVPIVLLLGWALLLVRTGPTLLQVLRAAFPGGTPLDPRRLSIRAVPAAVGLAYLLAFFLSDMQLQPLPWWLTNPREQGHLLLIPWMAWLTAALVALAVSLREERLTAQVPVGEWSAGPLRRLAPVPALGLVLVLAINLAAMIGMVRRPSAGLTVGPRAPAWDVAGFFLAPATGLDLHRSETLCTAYGPSAQAECWRGAAWAVGFGESEAEDPGEACRDLDAPWRTECLRGLGWSWMSQGAGGLVAEGHLAQRCELFGEERDRVDCWKGVGFPLGDHLAGVPERLMRALRELPPHRRPAAAQGAAMHLGRSFAQWSLVEHACAGWDPDLVAACLDGARESLPFRAD
jgi:hypothetical protein